MTEFELPVFKTGSFDSGFGVKEMSEFGIPTLNVGMVSTDTINKRLDSDERGIEIIYTPSGDQEITTPNQYEQCSEW